jgi:hypothetical protein
LEDEDGGEEEEIGKPDAEDHARHAETQRMVRERIAYHEAKHARTTSGGPAAAAGGP